MARRNLDEALRNRETLSHFPGAKLMHLQATHSDFFTVRLGVYDPKDSRQAAFYLSRFACRQLSNRLLKRLLEPF